MEALVIPFPKKKDRRELIVGAETKAERFDFLIEIGCLICRQVYNLKTAPEIHHIRTHSGIMRRDWQFTLPLCPEHHRGATGLHGMGRKAFEHYYLVEEMALLERADALIRLYASRP